MPEPSRFAFDLVMFDLDGTLVDTAAELADAVNDALAELGHSTVSQAQVRDWVGHGTRELLVQALASVSAQTPQQVRDSAKLLQALALFEPHYTARCATRSQPYPQADRVLRELRALGVRLAVVTNKDARFTDRILDRLQLTPLLDLVVPGDSVATKKPAPDGIHLCLARWGIQPGRALFVGDSSIDIASARNAGIAVWAVPYGYNLGQPIAHSRPDRLLDDLGQIVAGADGDG